MTAAPRRLEHRPRERARPLHGRAPDHPARRCSSGSPRSARRRRSPRSSPPARGGAASAVRRSRGSAAAASDRRPPRRRGDAAAADAGPLARGRAVRLQLDRVHRRGRHPVVRGEVRDQGQLRLLLEHRRGLRQARRRRRRLRHHASRSRSTSRTSSREGAIIDARQVAAPEHREPRRRVGRTRATTRATRTRCRTCGGRPASPTTPTKITDDADQLRRRSGTSAAQGHIAMLDDWQEVFAAGAHPARLLDANTTNDGRARRGARAARGAEAAGPDVHDRHDRRRCRRGDDWIGHIWGADVYQIQRDERRTSRTTSPRRAASAAPTRWRSSRGAQAPDRRAPVHQPPARRAGQRREHELHRLHGPERRGQGVHRPGDPRPTRRSTRTRRSSTSSQELLDLDRRSATST